MSVTLEHLFNAMLNHAIYSAMLSDLMCMNQPLTSLTGIVCRFKMQQKIGAQLVQE